jgi:hypothetical protein
MAKYKQNNKGLILRVGGRKSSNHYPIYEIQNGLRFELELKKRTVKLVQDFLFLDRIEGFE